MVAFGFDFIERGFKRLFVLRYSLGREIVLMDWLFGVGFCLSGCCGDGFRRAVSKVVATVGLLRWMLLGESLVDLVLPWWMISPLLDRSMSLPSKNGD